MPRASLDVLIPHYQDPRGLAISLAAVRLQDWRGRTRVVVADDGSDGPAFDEAAEICDTFRLESPHEIVLLRREDNRGRPRTRNELLDAAEASHIAWLDAGDSWSPSKLRHQFDYLSQMYHGGWDMKRTWITCDYYWIEGGDEPKKVSQDVSGDQLQKLLTGSRLRAYLWTLLGSRDSFMKTGYFDERLPRLQDLDYFVRFVRGGGRILRVRSEDAFATYYKSDVGRSARQVHDAYGIILQKNRAALTNYPPALSRELKHRSAKLAARFARNNNDRLDFLKYELEGMALKPVSTVRALAGKIVRRLIS